jgi:putative ABC transport system permease protein
VDLHDGRSQWTANRRTRAALLVSGLRWRARSSLAMFAVAVFSAGAAAFGPIYLHSADQLVLNRTLAGAAPGIAGLQLQPVTGHPKLAWLRRFESSVPDGTPHRWWGPPIYTERAGFVTIPKRGLTVPAARSGPSPAHPPSRATLDAIWHRPGATTRAQLLRIPKVPYRGTTPFVGSLVARTGECAHIKIVAGTCARGDGVVVSTRDAQTLGLVVGGSLAVVFNRTASAIPLPIVGIYLPGRPFAPYWWEENYFGFGPSSTATGLTNLDAVFATFAGVRALAPPQHIYILAQVPYRKGSLTVDTVGRFVSGLTSFAASSLRHEDVRASTGLFGLLHTAATVEHAAATVVGVVDLELVLLGILILFFVASRTSAEREPDVRLAELRGFAARSTIGVALAEPVTIVGAAVPMGFLVAWLVAGALAPAIFGPGAPVSITPLAIAAGVVAGAVGVAAAGLGARRSLVGGLSAEPTTPATAARTWWSTLADAAIVVVAGAAFFELVVSGDSGAGPSGANPLAAFAPGLLALGLGVLASRLVPRLLRATHRRTAFGPAAALSLATRTVARRREYRVQLLLVSLAVALATFGVSGWVIAARNRDERAVLSVGAPKVLTVSIRPGITFLRAVRAADPTGHDAMAAVVEHAKDGTTLAVDAPRLRSVAIWPANLGIPVATIARRLVPRHLAPPVRIRGSTLSVSVDASGFPSSLDPAPVLAADVFDVTTQFPSRVTLGPLRPGAHRYTGSLFADCPRGCHLLDLAVTWSPKASQATRARRVTLAVESMDEEVHGRWLPVRAGLRDDHAWTTLLGSARLFDDDGALGARFELRDGGTLAIAPADVPPALPVVATPTSNSTASGHGGPLVVGLDSSTLPGRTVAVVPSLPGVGTQAVLTNLATAEGYLSGRLITDTLEVWLARTAPHSIIGRLRSHGVRVLRSTTAAAAVRRLSHSGLDLAYLLYLVAAAAAGILLLGATAFALSSAARRRQGELAALRAVGISGRALRRAVQIEQTLVNGAGVVVGIISGAIAATVALRSVPEFAFKSPGPPLELGLPAGDLTAAVGAILVGLAATVALGSSVVVRGAKVTRLTGGQQ